LEGLPGIGGLPVEDGHKTVKHGLARRRSGRQGLHFDLANAERRLRRYDMQAQYARPKARIVERRSLLAVYAGFYVRSLENRFQRDPFVWAMQPLADNAQVLDAAGPLRGVLIAQIQVIP